MDFRPPRELVINDDIANNWKLFKQKFGNFLKASGNLKKDDDVKVAMLLNCVGDEALEAFNTFNLSEEDSKSYKKVIEAFDAFCEPRKNVIYNRFQFFSRKQEEGELFDHYLTSLKKLSKLCEFREEDELVRDRIVIGIRDVGLQERLLRVSDLTLKEAVNQCRAAESSKHQIQQLQGKPSKDLSINVVKKQFSNNKSTYSYNQPVRSTQNSKIQSRPKLSENKNRPNQTFVCGNCGKAHGPRACPAYGKDCNLCHRKNHFAAVCRNKNMGQQPRKRVHECRADEDEGNPDDDEEFFVNALQSQADKTVWTERIQLGDKEVECKLDTGAQCNVLPFSVFKSLNLKLSLQPNHFKILSYCNKELPTLGSVILNAVVRGKKGKIVFVVVDTDNVPILGLNTCIKLKLLQRLDNLKNEVNPNIKKPYKDKQAFVQNNGDIFEGTGKFPNKLKLELKENVVPVINPVRRVPESVKPKLKETLDNLVKNGTIVPVSHPTDWVNNIVIVEKPNKTLRICLDPAHLNKSLKVNPYPIPSSNELELLLRGKKLFSVLDMRDGFHQIELEEDSKLLTTFITPFGKYKYNKLPFGLSISPEIFQRYNMQMFGDIPNLGIYFDDFIVATTNEKEHDIVLNQIVQRARENNIKFNPRKLQFKVSTVKYLGLIFSENGVRPDPGRVESILALDEPKNKKELQSVLGIANFMCKFVPGMSNLTAPLRQLLKKNVEWNWSDAQSLAYKNLKCKIKEATVLKIFDPNLPTEIFVDASSTALGACLLQNKCPVAFSSRALNAAEVKYPIIDKEMAAICFAVKKFHHYIYGNNVTVFTDHKPILGIMDKSIFNVSSRLQKFKLKMLNYDLTVKYLPGKDNVVADILSRFTKSVSPVEKECIIDKFTVVHSLSNQLNMSVSKEQEFKVATNSDLVLSKVVKYLHDGWPDQKSFASREEKIFFRLKDDISYEDGLLFLGNKLIVPLKLRQNMLNLIHEAHLGVNKCKARARTIMYWPNMSNEIEKLVLSCKVCEKYRYQNGKEFLISHPKATRPWERVSCDLFDFGGLSYMVVIDSYSNWIELEEIKNKSSHCIIEKLKLIFSRFGVPDYFLSDNVPFASAEFKSFAEKWNFQPITSSPHYPRSNGLAEKGVSICKNLLRRSLSGKLDLTLLLLEYRNTPLNRLNVSPAQLFLNRLLKSKLPTSTKLLKPKVINRPNNNNNNGLNSSEYYYNRTANKLPEFQKGDNVLIRKVNSWVPGEVVNSHSSPRSYIVRDEEGKEYRRNRIMLRKSYNKPIPKSTDDVDEGIVSEQPVVNRPSNVEIEPRKVVSQSSCSRYGRPLKKPIYLSDYTT